MPASAIIIIIIIITTIPFLSVLLFFVLGECDRPQEKTVKED